MARYSSWRADDFRFTLQGRGAQGLFALAARQGAALRGIECIGDGYAAVARGRDRARLEALAARGGWTLTARERRGPGRWSEWLWRRPGLAVGLALCGLLLHLLGNFVWAMDLGTLDSVQQQELRALLAQNDICEGSYLTREELLQAQQRLSLHSDRFGWLSLNLTGGCLFVETTPLERQSVRPAAQDTALYARADGEILAVQVESGFAAVTPGQYVAQGQLLAAAARLDREGAPIWQAAEGQVLARVEQTYTAEQPLTLEAPVLTGRRQQRTTLYLPGWTVTLADEGEGFAQALIQQEWQPLQAGRVALPACCFTETQWEQRRQTLHYDEAAAEALAQRACRLQLAADFPDAVVETQSAEVTHTEEGVRCTVRYVFRADIAQAAPQQGEAIS